MVLIRPGMFDDKMSAEWRPGHHGRCTHGTGGGAGASCGSAADNSVTFTLVKLSCACLLSSGWLYVTNTGRQWSGEL